MSARLHRSAVSFRRQGSSGRIWDDSLIKSLDLKGPSTPTAAAAAAVAPLSSEASGQLARDYPSPRAASLSRSFFRHGGAAAASSIPVPDSPETAPHARPSPRADVTRGADGARHERRALRRRRGISLAFCACMGQPPASRAQQ